MDSQPRAFYAGVCLDIYMSSDRIDRVVPGQGVECAVGRFVDYGDSPEAVDLCAKNMVTGGDGVAYFSGNCLIASSKCVLPSRFVDELPE